MKSLKTVLRLLLQLCLTTKACLGRVLRLVAAYLPAEMVITHIVAFIRHHVGIAHYTLQYLRLQRGHQPRPPPQSCSKFETLPPEVVLKIFESLPDLEPSSQQAKDLFLVCRLFRNVLVGDQAFWSTIRLQIGHTRSALRDCRSRVEWLSLALRRSGTLSLKVHAVVLGEGHLPPSELLLLIEHCDRWGDVSLAMNIEMLQHTFDDTTDHFKGVPPLHRLTRLTLHTTPTAGKPLWHYDASLPRFFRNVPLLEFVRFDPLIRDVSAMPLSTIRECQIIQQRLRSEEDWSISKAPVLTQLFHPDSRLESLELWSETGGDLLQEVLPSLTAPSSFKSLKLRAPGSGHQSITNSLLQNLTAPSLEILEVRECRDTFFVHQMVQQSSCNLEQLSLPQTDVSAYVLPLLHASPSLTHLTLSICTSAVPFPLRPFLDHSFLPNLVSLTFIAGNGVNPIHHELLTEALNTDYSGILNSIGMARCEPPPVEYLPSETDDEGSMRIALPLPARPRIKALKFRLGNTPFGMSFQQVGHFLRNKAHSPPPLHCKCGLLTGLRVALWECINRFNGFSPCTSAREWLWLVKEARRILSSSILDQQVEVQCLHVRSLLLSQALVHPDSVYRTRIGILPSYISVDR